VLDEADEMLNMGFIEDVKEIFKNTNENKQMLLFSATMPTPILKLAKKHMRNLNIFQCHRKTSLQNSLTKSIMSLQRNKSSRLSAD
jgi:ATP-dependent RNA helicase DeaD